MVVHQEQAVFLTQELQPVLARGAIENAPLLEREAGFYSQYFLTPKKYEGVYFILDLHDLNLTLWTYVLLKFIVSQIQSENWFVTIDVKDGCVHTEILPEYWTFLRFTFGAY